MATSKMGKSMERVKCTGTQSKLAHKPLTQAYCLSSQVNSNTISKENGDMIKSMGMACKPRELNAQITLVITQSTAQSANTLMTK